METNASVPARRWLRPARPLILAGLLLVATLVVGVVSAGWSGPRAARSGAAIPDTWFLAAPVNGNNATDISVLEPQRNQMRPLLAGVRGAPLVAPDGRQLFFFERTRANDPLQWSIVAIDSGTLARQWSAPAGTAVPLPSDLSLATAIAADRVYVASFASSGLSSSSSSVRILAFDRATGQERIRWNVDLAARFGGGLRLVATPDGQTLVLLASVEAPQTPQLAYVRFHLLDGREELRRTPVEGPNATAFLWGWAGNANGRPTVDGRSLYTVDSTVVSFLDLTSGTIEQVNLGFRSGSYLPTQQTTSPDGRRLYVLAPTTGELGSVDLTTRRATGVVQVDTSLATSSARPSLLARAWNALRGLVVPGAAAKEMATGSMQFSPDGRRLYAIGMTGRGYDTRGSGVWAIDTATWQVTATWLPGNDAYQLLLSNNGRLLYVANSPWSGPALLTALDTATGATVYERDNPQGAQLFTLVERYRELYGQSPTSAGIPLAAGPDFVPLATLVPGVEPKTALAGDTVTVTARFTDPATGQTIQPGQPGLRYDEPTRVTATLSQRDPSQSVTLTLDRQAYGVYRGRATGLAPGIWSLRVVAEYADGTKRSAALASGATVQASFLGSDGRRYVVRITTEPNPPLVRRPATLQVAFVDATSGAPLPAGVTLPNALPDQLQAACFASVGVTTAFLTRVAPGVYTGPVTLWATEPWRVRLDFIAVLPDRSQRVTLSFEAATLNPGGGP